MKRFITRWLCLPLATLALGACNDDLSKIGESIQSPRDLVGSKVHYLQFEANTVEAPASYIDGTTTSLLGGIADPVYGDTEADFITQIRSARGFRFAQSPVGGQVDSVRLVLTFSASVGSATAPMQYSVYEVDRGYAGEEYSTRDLGQYAVASKLLGQRLMTISRDAEKIWERNTQRGDSTLRAQAISISLDRSLGQRIYDATQTNPTVFDSQTSLSAGLLGGFYVTSSTRGMMIQVSSVDLLIYYTYLDDKGKRQVAREHFLNTKLTPRSNAIRNTGTASLLAPSTAYTYIKGPSGVVTEISLAKEQMERLLTDQGQVNIGTSWVLADAPLRLKVDNPTNLTLNPPLYMVLMPSSLVASYFKQGLTERSESVKSYLSNAFQVDGGYYNFQSIARILTEHLKEHALYNATTKRWTVAQDLKLQMIPVDRLVSQQSSEATVTTALSPQLFPSFVRLSKNSKDLRIGVVSSAFKD